MAAYILTWNPEKTYFDEDEYQDIVERTRDGEVVRESSMESYCWSCGHTKRIQQGDRLFLLRQGTDRGMVGAGYATDGAYIAPHWDESKEGQEANYVDLEWETLLPVSFRLKIEELQSRELGVNWRYLIASGRQVPPESEAELESLWANHLDGVGWQTQYIEADDVTEAKTYIEGATRRVTVNAYERNRAARTKCIAHFGAKCSACGFDFARVYGEIGQGYIQVHHLLDLARIGREYKLDPIKDMRPVCPNCHTILHTVTPAMSIERLRDILSYRNVKH